MEPVQYKRIAGVEAANMGDEIGMLHIETGKYYMLDAVGADIWDLLQEPKTLDELVSALIKIYDVDRDQCYLESQDLIDNLLQNGLIEILRKEF